jgi:sugar/nucleoside kinase (ribokinase family)
VPLGRSYRRERCARRGRRGAAACGRRRSSNEVGAGDAFAAGFVYGLLQGWDATACARAGNVIAAGALAGTGDWETLPRLEDVRGDLIEPVNDRRRQGFA